MANENYNTSWGSPSGTVFTGGTVLTGGTVYTGGNTNPNDDPNTNPKTDGEAYIDLQYQLLSEWIDGWDPDSIGVVATNDAGSDWRLNFNCKFYQEYILNDLTTTPTVYRPKPIKNIKLALYEIQKDANNNFLSIKSSDGKSWSSQEYPTLKEVNKKLPLNHPLYGKLNDVDGTYKEVCTWIVPTGLSSYDTATQYGINKFYVRDFKFTIDYKLQLSYNSKKYSPLDSIPTNYKTGTIISKNKHYFIKVLPTDPKIGYSEYITLNSNDLTDTNGKLVILNGTFQPNVVFQNFSNFNHYRSGEGFLNLPAFDGYYPSVLAKITNNIEPGAIGTKYDTTANPYIIKNNIDNSKFYDTWTNPLTISLLSPKISNYVNYNNPWSISFLLDSSNRIDIYYSPVAWFKTPAGDYKPKGEIKLNTIKQWEDPDPDANSSGYWYQIFDSWAWDDINKMIYVRKADDDDLPIGYNEKGYGGHFDQNLKEFDFSNSQDPICYPIHYYFNYTFEKDYNYQFIVHIKNFAKPGSDDLKITTPWVDKISLNIDLTLNTNHIIKYNAYSGINSFSSLLTKSLFPTNDSIQKANLTNEYKIKLPEKKPISRVVSSTNPKNPITITANTNFNNSKGIQKIVLYKTKWFIQSYAAYTDYTNDSLNTTLSSSGWHAILDQGVFIFLNKKSDPDYPFISDPNDHFSKKYRYEEYIIDNYYNFICRYLQIQTFNLSFDYTNNTDLKLDIYTSINLPVDPHKYYKGSTLEELLKDGSIKKIGGTLGKSFGTNGIGSKQNCEFVGLEGNQYILLVVSGVTDNLQQLRIENLKVEGEYHELNNTLFKNLNSDYKDTTNNIETSYAIKLGSGNNVDKNAVNDIYVINSKIGNSNFQSGIWETGVWQSGWMDTKQYSFIDIDLFYSYDSDKRWRFILTGNKSTSDFNIGDKISISNVVVIDINGDRRLIKNYFTIVEKTETSLVIEFFYDFPVRSVERDSENHYIIVTKSIWLSGIFLNGRFKGNWVDGTFKGYPFITKMEDSHWVDGVFDGGHFKSNSIKYTYNTINSKDVYLIISTLEENNFRIDDSFYLYGSSDKIYEREFKVLSIINSKSFYSDIRKDDGVDFSKVVYLKTTKNSGLIQNFDFNSNNSSDKTISKSFNTEYVFSYNSWLDLVYDTTSATNIFKTQNIPDNTGNFYSENNLYGYITNDVLSSVSKFRDSFSNTVRDYKLGTKWKIFHDYIGESSSFDEYFHSVYTPKKTSEIGWSFNLSNNPLPKTSRFIGYRTDDKNEDITGKELKIVAEGDGGVLNLDNKSSNNIPLRYTEKIRPNGYSLVSFDLISYDVYDNNTTYQKGIDDPSKDTITWYNGTFSIVDSNSKNEPILSFSNTNQTNLIRNGITYNTKMTYLPIYENINHLETPGKKKIEYFFNKRDLMLSLKGSGVYGSSETSIVIDNLKFYEIDMIPFFQYFTINNINKGVQIPNGIDYVRFNYTQLNYNYVSYTNFKSLNYFNYDKFQKVSIYDSKYWVSSSDVNNLDTNNYFNKSI